MFGNALIFISNPYFNTCLRVDATMLLAGFEKLKTYQGYLHDEQLNPKYEFDSTETEHIALNQLNALQFCFVEFDKELNVLPFNSVMVEVQEPDMLDYIKEVFAYAKGIQETQEIKSIYTIYFD